MVKQQQRFTLTYLRSTSPSGWSTAGVADSKFISESLLLKCYPYKPSERVFIKVISLRSFCILSLVYQLSLSPSTSQLVVDRTVRVLGILLGQLALVTFARSLLGQSIRGLGLGYILVRHWQSFLAFQTRQFHTLVALAILVELNTRLTSLCQLKTARSDRGRQ